MQEEGYVAAILYPDGAKDVELGKIVAVIVEDEADVAAFKDPSKVAMVLQAAHHAVRIKDKATFCRV